MLQSSASNHGHLISPDGFLLPLANQNTMTERGEGVNCRKANMALENYAAPPPPQFSHIYWPVG